MPQVIVERYMNDIDPNHVWEIARKVTDYPKFMDQVVSVEPLGCEEVPDSTAWTVLLNGNELRWIEVSTYDDMGRRMMFQQIEGDLAEWSGFFEILEQPGGILARYQIEFDLGIPALAAELHPLGENAIRANCNQMLEQMEIRSRCLSEQTC